jgi:hypothetical protein
MALYRGYLMHGNPREDYLTGNSRHLIKDTQATEDVLYRGYLMQGNPREDYLTGNSRHLIKDTEATEDVLNRAQAA